MPGTREEEGRLVGGQGAGVLAQQGLQDGMGQLPPDVIAAPQDDAQLPYQLHWEKMHRASLQEGSSPQGLIMQSSGR